LHKHFVWHDAVTTLIKFAWQQKAAERYRALMCSMRKGKEKSVHVPDTTWQKWNEAWSTPEFRSRSEQFTTNRRSETGGLGTGIARHTGGSISHAQHHERLVRHYLYLYIMFVCALSLLKCVCVYRLIGFNANEL
jgi:hypothetical protein